jgi:hypothetical protein
MGNQWTALTPDDGWTLGEVKWHWGNAYAVFRSLSPYCARRRDGIGAVLVVADLDALVSLIRRDYVARPVAR